MLIYTLKLILLVFVGVLCAVCIGGSSITIFEHYGYTSFFPAVATSAGLAFLTFVGIYECGHKLLEDCDCGS